MENKHWLLRKVAIIKGEGDNNKNKNKKKYSVEVVFYKCYGEIMRLLFLVKHENQFYSRFPSSIVQSLF